MFFDEFEYDIQRDVMYKINDRYEFPLELDLTRFLDPSSATNTEDNTYCLVSVLVHSGDVSGGHYYAFIKPYPDEDQWYKFDDERVYKVKKVDGVDENFGGADERKSKYFWLNAHVGANSAYKKFTNAYMLVYIRKSEINTLLKRVEEQDVPEHLGFRFKQEREEKERIKREKAESWKYCNVKVATDDDLKHHGGTDLVSFDNVEAIRVKKDSSLNDLKDLLSHRMNVPPERLRFWKWERRQNKTNRPHSVIEHVREHAAIERIFPVTTGDVCLYLEVADPRDQELPFEPVVPQQDLIVFFKYYRPENKTLQYVGSKVLKHRSKLGDVVPWLKSLVDLPQDVTLDIYEEVRPSMVEPVYENSTFKQAELQHGDILVFQKTPTQEEYHQYDYPTVNDYYKYLFTRVEVAFCKLEEPDVIVHTLELLKTNTYGEVVGALAKVLNTEPQFIRLTGHNPYSHSSTAVNTINSSPFKTTDVKTLKDMLQMSTTRFYYEILDVPITEMENKKELNIAWYNEKVEEVEKIRLLAPKENSFADVLQALREKLAEKMDVPSDRPIRIMAIQNHRIYRHLTEEDSVDRFSSNIELRAEFIPLEELNLSQEQRSIQVLHFCKDSLNIRAFGAPFWIVIGLEDTVGQVKQTIQNKIQVKEEEWKKYKFAPLLGIHRGEYLTEDDKIFVQVLEQTQNTFNAHICLGMEHKDPTPRQSSRWYDKPIIIKN
jgi:ubiquitin carboxyl-terminal hydrolase 7